MINQQSNNPTRTLWASALVLGGFAITMGGWMQVAGVAPPPPPPETQSVGDESFLKILPVRSNPVELLRVLDGLRPPSTLYAIAGDGVLVFRGLQEDVERDATLAMELDAIRQTAVTEERKKAHMDHVQKVTEEEWVRTPVAINLETGPTLGDTLSNLQAVLAKEQIELNVLWNPESLAALPVGKAVLKAVTVDTVVGMLPRLAGNSTIPFTIAIIDAGNTRGRSLARRPPAALILVEPAPVAIPLPALPEEDVAQILTARIESLTDEGIGTPEAIKQRQADVLAAIETGLSVLGEKRSEKFQVKLHPPTGMVFICGNAKEIVLA